MLQVGDAVPEFSLESDSAGTISAKALRGKRYVIFFYPKDNTPGCTKEACSFRDHLPTFKDLGVPVFGASADDAKAHGKFATKYELNFPLLIDPEKQLLEAFGVWVEKSMYGRTYFGVQRATYVIDAKGKVEHLWPKVKPEGHAAQVLEYLQG
jgi:peroxiredoxin Q/BCP